MNSVRLQARGQGLEMALEVLGEDFAVRVGVGCLMGHFAPK